MGVVCVVFMARQVDSGVSVVGLNSGCGHVVRAGDSWSAWVLVWECLVSSLEALMSFHIPSSKHPYPRPKVDTDRKLIEQRS